MENLGPWLYRTKRNEIGGPVSVEEIRKKVLEKELGPEDEICAARGYWIFIHEVEEVQKWLGVIPPYHSAARDSDVTQTQTTTTLTEKISEWDSSMEGKAGTQQVSVAASPSVAPSPVRVRGGAVPSEVSFLAKVTPTFFWRILLVVFGLGLGFVLFLFLNLVKQAGP